MSGETDALEERLGGKGMQDQRVLLRLLLCDYMNNIRIDKMVVSGNVNDGVYLDLSMRV